MKIAVFIKSTTFNKGYGGLETQNKLLCEGLASLGHEVVVFTPKRDIEIDIEKQNSVNYRFVTGSYRYLFAKIDKNNWYNTSFDNFKEEHEKKSFDIVISQSSAGIGIIERKNELGIKVVSIAHGSILAEIQTALNSLTDLRGLFNLLKNTQYALRQFFGRQRDFVLRSDKVVAVSESVKRQLIEETYVPGENIKVIHNGIKFYETTDAMTSKKDHFRILYVGQVIKEKGLDFFVELFKDTRFKNIEVDIIGDGNYFEKLKRIISEQGMSKNINLLGKKPYNELVKYYSRNLYDIFVFPTRRVEGFPMVLVEAMYGGLPIVAFNLGGVSDAVSDGKTGFLVEYGKFNDFKDKIYYYMKNEIQIEIMGENARKQAQAEFSWELMVERYEKLLLEVLK